MKCFDIYYDQPKMPKAIKDEFFDCQQGKSNDCWVPWEVDAEYGNKVDTWLLKNLDIEDGEEILISHRW
tara:strand:+ start:611 stop:817 length:207 start_codon:yes stop_codon:yes gene_type:complete